MGEWLTRFKTELPPGTVGAQGTLDNYAWAIDNHLVPGLGALALVDLSPADVGVFLHHKLESGLAVRSVARLRTVLATALGHAVLLGHLPRNVALLVRAPRGPVGRGRSLSLSQARRLLEAARGQRFEAAFVLMLVVGLRPDEALGLRWADVDLDAGVLTVTQALKRDRAGTYLGTTKTPQSHRRVALPDLALDALRRRALGQAEERARAGGRWVETGLVFTARHGGLVEPRRVGLHLARLTEGLGLGPCPTSCATPRCRCCQPPGCVSKTSPMWSITAPHARPRPSTAMSSCPSSKPRSHRPSASTHLSEPQMAYNLAYTMAYKTAARR